MKPWWVLAACAGLFQAGYMYTHRGGCGTEGALACPAPEMENALGVVVKASKICHKAGYLCEGRKAFDVRRWSLEQGKLRIRAKPPDYLEPTLAFEVHNAAVEGIMVWDGRPFPIIMDAGAFSFTAPDINLFWPELAVSPEVKWQNIFGSGERGFQPNSLTLVLPQGLPKQELLEYVKDAATHEMGHALGLGHSSVPKDIMYFDPKIDGIDPKLQRVTNRDLATIEMLYQLPNEATVK